MGLNVILILVTSLAYRTSAQVCCGVSSANLVRLGIMEVQLGVERSQRKTEMQWRIAEEKCANKMLQDQLTEIQEKLDTHISVCGYDYRFTIDNKEPEDFVTVAPYREVFVDNSRVGGKMKKGKELLDPETGMFTVPEEADGEYEFSASLSADTYQDTDEPFNRPAYWAIMKEGKEKEAITEVTSSEAYGDMFSAGIMFGDAGNNMQADTISLSKTVIFSLKAGDKVHLAAIRKDGYFPYAGRFISFCAKLINRDATNVITGVHSTDNPCPVLGPRHDCAPKAGSEKPVEDTSLSTQLGQESSEAAAEAEKDAAEAKESGNEDKIQEAEEKKAEIKQKQENDKKKKCDVKKKEKENKETRKKKEQKKKEEKEKEDKCREEEMKAKQDATKESKGEGEKKWYIDKDCETNITVILWKEDELVKEKEKGGNQNQKGNKTIELMDTKKFMERKQEEMKCEQTRKVNAYNATEDPMLDQDAPVPKCCPSGEKCNEAGEPLGTESNTQAGSTGDNEEQKETANKPEDESKTDDGSNAEDEEEEEEEEDENDGCPK